VESIVHEARRLMRMVDNVLHFARTTEGRVQLEVALTELGPLVESIAATVPEDIRSTGRLIIGVNVPYAPNEFKDTSGAIVGFDVDLMNAITRTLGLVPEYRESPFDAIIPSVRGGDFNVGMSSYTDTKEREEKADFVTYFEAGTLWAQRPGAGVDPANACGLTVGVAIPSLQEAEEIPAKSAACEAAGNPPIDKRVFDDQDELNRALINGEVDAMSADSPVTGFAQGESVIRRCISSLDHSEGSSVFQKSDDFAGSSRPEVSISADDAISFRPARLERIINGYAASTVCVRDGFPRLPNVTTPALIRIPCHLRVLDVSRLRAPKPKENPMITKLKQAARHLAAAVLPMSLAFLSQPNAKAFGVSNRTTDV